MIRLLTLLIVALLVVAVAAEVVVPSRIEESIERRVTAEVPGAALVDARLDSFPVVARGLATGNVDRLVVTLEDVALPELQIESVQVEVTGIEMSRRAIFDGELGLERIERGSLTAVVTEDALEEDLPGGAELSLTPGRAEVEIAGRSVGSDVTVSDGQVRFELGRLPDASVRLPGPEFFPCPLGGEVVHDAVRLGCTLERVPDYLLRRIDGG